MTKIRRRPAETQRFYREVLSSLKQGGVPFMVGGAYALAHYTGVMRETQDLDLFLERRHLSAALDCLSAISCRRELTFPHWLAKARRGRNVVDLIFNSGNGVAAVDSTWFAHAASGMVLGVRVDISPVEEMIWSKAFIMERRRCTCCARGSDDCRGHGFSPGSTDTGLCSSPTSCSSASSTLARASGYPRR